jgi:hypothetical protein
MLVGAWPIGHVSAALSPAPAGERARKQAAAAVEAGARAFAAGEYARALAEFERAMALRPSPKLHYNIGVCREQLMLAARARGEAAKEAEHAAAAVESFNAYLRDVPGAGDRIEVEETIRRLGGTPLTQPQLKPIPPARGEEPGAIPDEESDEEPDEEPATAEPPANAEPSASEFPPPPGPASEPATPPQERTILPAPSLPRGRVGGGFGLLIQPQIPTTRLDGAVQGLLSGRLGGFFGARRRVYVGAGVLLAAAGETAANKLALNTQAVTLDVEYGHPVGQAKRVELVFGGFAIGAREALRARPEQELPACSATSGRLVSQRGGGGAGGRLGFLVLLGPRKNHEIGVRASTAVLGFGTGTASCEPRPFADHAVPRVRLFVFTDIGYSFRF